MASKNTKVDAAIASLRGPVTRAYTDAVAESWRTRYAEDRATAEMRKMFRPAASVVKAYIRKRLGNKRYPIIDYHEGGYGVDHSKKPEERMPWISFRVHLDGAGVGHRIAIDAQHTPKDCADLDVWLDGIIAMRDAYAASQKGAVR